MVCQSRSICMHPKGLVTDYEKGGGGATKRERGGGDVKFYPYEKGGRKTKIQPC